MAREPCLEEPTQGAEAPYSEEPAEESTVETIIEGNGNYSRSSDLMKFKKRGKKDVQHRHLRSANYRLLLVIHQNLKPQPFQLLCQQASQSVLLAHSSHEIAPRLSFLLDAVFGLAEGLRGFQKPL